MLGRCTVKSQGWEWDLGLLLCEPDPQPCHHLRESLRYLLPHTHLAHPT